MTNNSIRRLRHIGLIEGVSFLLLLFIAMPLKYFAGMPLAVKIFGWAHGVLFVVFIAALIPARKAAGWGIGYTAVVFLAALLPFGPFLMDGRLKRWEADVVTTANDDA